MKLFYKQILNTTNDRIIIWNVKELLNEKKIQYKQRLVDRLQIMNVK
jgi:hypothetical protein